MMEFEPGHWARVRQITHTKCTGKLRAQLALTGRVGDLPFTQKKGIASLYISFVFSTRKLFAVDCHRLNMPLVSSCFTAFSASAVL